MKKDVNQILEFVDCRLRAKFMASKTPEVREWYEKQADAYRHLCACPLQNGWWGYKEHCLRCYYAIKKPADVGASTGEGK